MAALARLRAFSKIYVPPALYVTWPDRESRSVFVVGRLLKLALDSDEFEYAYTEGSRAAEKVGFRGFVSFPELERVCRCDALPPFFSNRVMTPRRPDFPQYLRELGLTPGEAGPLTILARSAGRRQTDPCEVFAELMSSSDANRQEGWFLLRGLRHVPNAEENILQLNAGDVLAVVPEPTNAINPKALQLHDQRGAVLGWVPDYLVNELGTCLENDATTEVRVECVNPPPAPYQHRLLCRWSTSGELLPFHDPMREPRSKHAVVLQRFDFTGTA